MRAPKHSGRFQAYHHSVDGRTVTIGYFDTAVESAVAYARAVGAYQPPAPPSVISADGRSRVSFSHLVWVVVFFLGTGPARTGTNTRKKRHLHLVVRHAKFFKTVEVFSRPCEREIFSVCSSYEHTRR